MILARKFVHIKMHFITGLSPQQLQICSVKDKMALDSPLRFIEVFVEQI